ncbi:MAG: IS110 family transposase, partial [Rhodobacteraceae bacterium]|nr:IS110 family transposase [Paracoccaceae bacterium]
SFYDRLIGEGKAHKVALTAVMRKLVILANVLVRDDRNWTATAPEPGVG